MDGKLPMRTFASLTAALPVVLLCTACVQPRRDPEPSPAPPPVNATAQAPALL
jgi:hypothetical protein